jgi:hypothetical protein
MKKIIFAALLLVIGMLFSSTAIAHEGEDHDGKMYEEGSGGAAKNMGNKASGMDHEYKVSGEHSKEHYEKKYGKYEHDKKEGMEEGSGMKEDAYKMQEQGHESKEEGSKM